jgi:hypothetical protein
MKYHCLEKAGQRLRGIVLLVVGILLLAPCVCFTSSPAVALAHDRRANANPTFAITAPIYNGVAEGPVGTNIAISAQGGWTPNTQLKLYVASVSSTCDAQAGSGLQVSLVPAINVNNNGGFSGVFVWPSAANQTGAYNVCASDGTLSGVSSTTFTLMSSTNGHPSNNPIIVLSFPADPNKAATGDQITVVGSNWLPGGSVMQVHFRLQPANTLINQQPDFTFTETATPDSSGAFQQKLTLPTNIVDNREVLAYGGPSVGSTFALVSTSASFVIVVAPTATTAPTPTVAPTATTGNSNPGGTQPGDNNGNMWILLLGLIAIILLIAGIVVAMLALRGRGPSTNDGQGDPYGSQGGPYTGYGQAYDPYAQAPQGGLWDETAAGGTQTWQGDNIWENPSGHPWSGRESGFRGDPESSFDSERYDDPYRTRMTDMPGGQPGMPPGPGSSPVSRPGTPPPSRPNQASRPNQMSRPTPPQSPWDDDGPTRPQTPYR